MGLFSFLAGKSPEDMEIVGDNYIKVKEYGAAKVEFESALAKAKAKFPEKQNLIDRLLEKINQTKESLAIFHKQSAQHLAASGNYKEAEDLLALALELTQNTRLKEEISAILKKLIKEKKMDYPEASNTMDTTTTIDTSGSEPDHFIIQDEVVDEDEYFLVLCHAQAEDVQAAYQNYGQQFKEGFIALNRGEFETALKKLSEAMDENSSPHHLIPLELATAQINLGQYDHARRLLEQFVKDNPEVLRGYQILCDIFWVIGDYDRAVNLIAGCPDKLKETFPIQFLLGETLYQMERYPDAEKIFQACLDNFGENEIATRSLAKTYEAMGEMKKACDIYGGILKGCTRCGARTDPFVKRRYADLCYASDERSQRLLELYLSLVQEDPDNKLEYFQRIHGLYEALGDMKEARRYQSFLGR
jgi:tetratricopeptide (TPR) repeat protein